MAANRDVQAGSMNGERWSMGSVVSRTGISEHTLRAWERRFGFPKPTRLPSGHRRYTSDDVQRLQLIASALELGYRAGDVVRASPGRLVELIGGSAYPVRAVEDEPGWMERILEAAARFDRPAMAAEVRHHAAASSTLSFLDGRLVPLLVEVGERWRQGRLDIRHEHFISEVLDDEIRSMRRLLEAGVGPSSIVLAGLPDEQHGLGMQMVALLAAARGVRTHLLGLRVPIADIAETVTTTLSAVVGVTISGTVPIDSTEPQLRELRSRLAPSVALWLGGAGASEFEGMDDNVTVLTTLGATDRALDGLT